MYVIFNAEFRGVEQKISQKTSNPYLLFHMEDENSKSFDITSKDLTLVNGLKKGDFVSCKALLNISKFTIFELISIQKK